MKRLVTLMVALTVSACAQSGDGIVQDPPANPDPNPQPDPVITTPINSRLVGKLHATATGAGQDAKYEFDSIFEFREKQAGKLIGYSQMRDKLQNGKLVVDYWAQGQRNNADVQLSISLNTACGDMKLKGKLDLLGNISFPKTTQKLGCGFLVSISVITEATVLTRDGEANRFSWKAIEAHFAPK